MKVIVIGLLDAPILLRDELLLNEILLNIWIFRGLVKSICLNIIIHLIIGVALLVFESEVLLLMNRVRELLELV